MADTMNLVLNLPKNDFWYDAILSDDFKVIFGELEKQDDLHRELLVNGTFNLRDESLDVKIPKASRAWHLVVSFCSVKTIQLFISKGVHLQSTDEYKHNIIHTMVLMSAFKPEMEETLMEKYVYIMAHITKEEKFGLLMNENEGGMRPLEFAAHLATTGFFQG